MFYSKDILQKKGGKFGKLWLAATHMSKLSRRDVAAINVEQCCDDILTYVELRVPPSQRGGRRPRFSLYLSALLMSGAVRVHNKQAQYLYADASTVLIRVRSMPTISSNIDLLDIPRADQVTNPDVGQEVLPADTALDSQLEREIFLQETGFVDKDHFWGLNGSTPPVAELEEPLVPKPKRRKKQQEDVTIQPAEQTVPIEQITLQEAPPLLMDTPLSPIQVPRELDLPMLDGREMELLMSHVEEGPLQVTDLLPTSTPFPTDKDGPTRQNLRSEQSNLDSPSISTWRLDGERTPDRVPPPMVLPEDRAMPPSPGVTQITSPLPRRLLSRKFLELELTPMTPSPVRRQRKRQLTFADAETQIPKSRMRDNLRTGDDTCTQFVLTDKSKGAADLIAVPGDRVLRKRPWLPLWERNARFRRNIAESDLAEAISPVLPAELPAPELPVQIPEELPLQPEIQPTDVPTVPTGSPFRAPSTEEVRRKKRKTSTLEQSIEEMRKITSMSESLQGPAAPELSSMEIQRDASALSLNDELQQAAVSMEDSLLLDESRQSKKDRSIRKRRTRSSTGNDSLQASLLPPLSSSSQHTSHTSAAHTLYDVVEEPRFEAPFIAVPLTQEYNVTAEEFLKKVEDDIGGDETADITSFNKICPPQIVDRKTAASEFTALLDLCARRHIVAEQMESFGEIYIRLAE